MRVQHAKWRERTSLNNRSALFNSSAQIRKCTVQNRVCINRGDRLASPVYCLRISKQVADESLHPSCTFYREFEIFVRLRIAAVLILALQHVTIDSHHAQWFP